MRFVFIAIALLFVFVAHSANAGEGWQGRPSVCANITDPARSERCHYWVDTVRIPGTEGRCCGEADAYMTDWEIVNGELWMTIIADYPPPTGFSDEEGNTVAPPPNAFWGKKGTRIKIPPEKMVTRFEDRNQSPHSVVFLSSTGTVYCAILGPLI